MEQKKMRKIFRTIVLVTIFDLSGWGMTQTLVATQNFIDLPGKHCLNSQINHLQITNVSATFVSPLFLRTSELP